MFCVSTSLLFCILVINPVYSEIDEAQRKMLDTLPPDQRDAILNKIEQADKLTGEIEEKFEKKETLVRRDEYEDADVDKDEDGYEEYEDDDGYGD